MATPSLIVTKTDGTTDLTFYLVSQSGTTSRYAMSTNASALKQFIDVDLRVAPSGSKQSDLYTITLRREELNATTGALVVSKVSFQLTIPKDDSITAAEVGNDISCLMSLFNKTFMDSFVLGIVLSGDYNVTGPFNPARA